MAMASPVPYGNMPTIRCTNCGAETDIARAGDHICGNVPQQMQPMDRFNNAFSSMKSNNNIPHPFMPRPAPTRTDPGIASSSFPLHKLTGAKLIVADRPYYPSPLSPHAPSGPLPPFRLPPRSKTASPRPPPLRPPSPDRPLPQECAFPAFPLPSRTPTAKVASPRPRDPSPEPQSMQAPPEPQQPTMDLPASLRPMVGNDKRDTASTYSVAQDSRPHSRSSSSYRPMTAGSDSTRKASFSSTRSRPEWHADAEPAPPMPFFSDRVANMSPGPIESPRLPFGDSPEANFSNPYEHLPPAPPPPVESPPRSLGHFRKQSQSAASRPLHEIGSTKLHRPTLSRGVSPARLDVDFGKARSTSALSNRSDVRLHDAPPVPGMETVQIEDLNAPNQRENNGPWPTKPASNGHLPYNPYRDLHTGHSPTESMSSNGSIGRTQSSRSSPPTSAASFEPIKERYGMENSGHYDGYGQNHYTSPRDYPQASPPQSEYDSNDTATPPPAATSRFPPHEQSRYVASHQLHSIDSQYPPPESQQPSLPQLDFEDGPGMHGNMQQPTLPSLDMRQPTLPALDMNVPQPVPSADLPQPRRRPAKSFSRPNYARPVGLVEPESPMDPAMQGNRLAPIDTGAFPPESGHMGGQQMPLSAPPGGGNQDYMDHPKTPLTAPPMRHGHGFDETPPPPASAPPTRTGPSMPPPPQAAASSYEQRPFQPLRRATTGARGNCRGCSEPIKGKSVSSADGRLTGRWHKHCFVCKTCQQPFPSNDFYVFGNQPYCSRHYHQLNRTLCSNCDRGIEGQFVETDRHTKFHPHCFSCMECHLILRDNYFEDASGKILCEQHAFNTNKLGPGRRFPERRTTRLMMMS